MRKFPSVWRPPAAAVSRSSRPPAAAVSRSSRPPAAALSSSSRLPAAAVSILAHLAVVARCWRTPAAAAALAPLALLACSSEVTDPPQTTDFDHDAVVSMSLTVKPGEELHKCQFV